MSWGRDVFSLALAIQMLLWGAERSLWRARLPDRYGPVLVMSGGAILYAIGLAAMAYATTPAMLQITAGVIIGFGLAGCSFTLVIGAFGRLMPPQWRSLHSGSALQPVHSGSFCFRHSQSR